VFCAGSIEQQQSGLIAAGSRQLLVCQWTMLSNPIFGHLAELGIISAKGPMAQELLKTIANERHPITVAARFCLDALGPPNAPLIVPSVPCHQVNRCQQLALPRRGTATHKSAIGFTLLWAITKTRFVRGAQILDLPIERAVHLVCPDRCRIRFAGARG
jgi:hypothetical protein